MVPMNQVLLVSFLLFSIGVAGVLIRRNALIILMCVELMLNAANLNLIAFARHSGTVAGQAFALLVMGLAAAEVAIGLALVVALYRKKDTVQVDGINLLKG
ncbi:NADH-quinone oxidoreductase subunit NuoK [Holophaga foetida]|uniref:NADH-quinone oxidoreductase subunit NuoK n=1 Tax=Holophaga foetida TaxID=35839 RepID=UPI0002472197|nr:NADH-quinone oxidoreductase subunit NuoK [Holophaga foetida]